MYDSYCFKSVLFCFVLLFLVHQLVNMNWRCGKGSHSGSWRRESIVAIENVQQFDPDPSWFILGREVVAAAEV